MKNNIIWDVLTIGHFSRNIFWGEDENGKPCRDAVCTSVLVRCNGVSLLIDPPYSGEKMKATLDNRCGLKLDDIDTIFITHAHYDHCVGLPDFPHAKVLCSQGELDALRTLVTEKAKTNPAYLPVLDNISAVLEDILPGISTIPLPGHTAGLTGVLFQADEGRVLVSGDAVMTKAHFYARHGSFCVDPKQASDSIEKIAGMADVVVPGHDNYFLVLPKELQ